MTVSSMEHFVRSGCLGGLGHINDEVLDEHVTNIIANHHLFVSNDEEECVGELDDEEFQSSGLGDEENVKSIGDDEEEYMCDINGEESQSSGLADEDEEIKSIGGDEECVGEKEYQSSGLADDETSGGDDEECVGGGLNSYQSSDHGDEGSAKSNVGDDEFVGYVKTEEYQSNELGAEETTKGNNKKYGRWKIGAFVVVCSLVIISIAAGVGANNSKRADVNREGGGVGETASVTVVPQENENEAENENESENVSETLNDVATPPPSICIAKKSFEIAMADEVEEFSCNMDKQCDGNADIGACVGNNGTICDGACNSPEACIDNQGDIQSCSCLGVDACNTNEGDVGLFACNGKHACKKNSGTIGTLSCNDHNRACFDNHGNVAPESCNGVKACLENDGSISLKSCNNLKSCHENTGPVGERSCNGQESCMKNFGTIGAKSCNGEKSCCGNTEDIGSGECNGDFECCNSDVSQCDCTSLTNVTSTLDSLASVEEAPTNAPATP
eukprot:scaffold5596_cov132-Skeletonema_dohrnii-CCMP3373.AAC.10